MSLGWQVVTTPQAGVLSRAQALSSGLTRASVDHQLRTGRWVRAYPGVYRTFTGPATDLARTWAAVLYAGAGATLDAGPTLWLAGVVSKAPGVCAVLVPADRRVKPQPGLSVALSTRIDGWRHAVAAPPQLRVEAAVLRATETCADDARVVDLVIAATASRRTTTARLRAELAHWQRLRWRRLLGDLLEDVTDGVASALELQWRRKVELAHGLPQGARNQAEQLHGRRIYRDLRYDPFAVVAELDGRAAHPEIGAFRDRQRDNAAARQLDLALRYGWREVAGDPCGCAAELADLLRRRGWGGTLRRCGPSCSVQPAT